MKNRFVLVLSIALPVPAMAQIPTQDAQRLTQETGIANCMQRARQSSEATVQPSSGVRESMKAPGSGQTGAAGQIGNRELTGNTIKVAAGRSTPVGNLDGTSVGLLSSGRFSGWQLENYGQATDAINSVSPALSNNIRTFNAFGGAIGSVNSIQGGFDQNSASRTGTASVWNQALQVGNTTLILRNQALSQQMQAVSGTAKVMYYDPDKAGFVKPASRIRAENQENTIPQRIDLDEVEKHLKATQDAANSPRNTTSN